MNVKVVRYERLFSLGNYEHEKIGVELELAENEVVSDVFDRARAFVEGQNRKRRNAEWIRCKKQDLKDYQARIADQNLQSDPENYMIKMTQNLQDEIMELEMAQYPEL